MPDTEFTELSTFSLWFDTSKSQHRALTFSPALVLFETVLYVPSYSFLLLRAQGKEDNKYTLKCQLVLDVRIVYSSILTNVP